MILFTMAALAAPEIVSDDVLGRPSVPRAEVLYLAGPPLDEPLAPGAWSVLDYGNVVLARPVGDEVSQGFGLAEFDRAVGRVLQDRKATYDFAVVIETPAAPSQFSGFGAFFLPMNNADITGTGNRVVQRPDRTLRGALWMNSLQFWSPLGDDVTNWVFGQELGHHWLAFPHVDLGEGRERTLLGRDDSHWSYFMDTGASPMEGNRWTDNGDGTFTTDPASGPGLFSDLDLYMMGLLGPDDVEDWFVIDPDPSVSLSEGTAPDGLFAGAEPTTVPGTRIDLSVDDVIAAEGLVSPGPGDAPTDFRLLTVLVVGPAELVSLEQIEAVVQTQEQWQAWWALATRGLSSVDFAVTDEGLSAPPLPTAPALIPRGAW